MLYPLLIDTDYAQTGHEPFWLGLTVNGQMVAAVRTWGAFDTVAAEVAQRLRNTPVCDFDFNNTDREVAA